MADEDKKVFLSYRRETSSFIARSIFQWLRQYDYDVFMDVETPDPGTLKTTIRSQIAARPHFLVILTPNGISRCSDPQDWLRWEIEQAMDQGRNIVPIQANGFDFNKVEQYLTGKLSKLKDYNGLILSEAYFDASMNRLVNRFLKPPVSVLITPTPASEEKNVQRKIEKAVAKSVAKPTHLDAKEYYTRGAQAYRKDDLQGAIDNFNRAININPGFAEAFSQRALARKDMGDLKGALSDYNRSIELNNPRPEIPLYGRGIVRYKLGDFDGAISDFTQALLHDPDYLNCLLWRAAAYRERGENLKAIFDYNRYLELGGGDRYGNQAEVEGYLRNLRITEQVSTDLFVCPLCNRKFKSLAYLEKHKAKSHSLTYPEPHSTLISGTGSISSTFKKRLFTPASSPNPVICPHCGRKFKNAAFLERHVATNHTGTRFDDQFICPQCGLPFKRQSDLDEHIANWH